MNYIPGFSNYLEASVPEYGPAPIMDAEPVAPQRAAVAPMTQEASVPYDLSGLAGLDLSGLNFGTNFGGGAMGGQYQADPNLQYIAAPLSNKGNATSQTGGNAFAVKADQPVRLVDHRTNQVVFEGSGFDAARKATELGQGLTDQFGRKANYSIQTADPAGNYSTVAYEKKNKSTLGQIGNVVGTLAPLALMAIPGFGQLGLAAQIAAGAGAGGVGAALKGDNILKGIAMGGLSAAGGQILGGPLSKIGASNIGLRAGTAIGTGIGSTAGGLVTGQSLKNSLLGGVASGALSYMSPDITKGLKGLGIGSGASANTSSGGGGGYDGILVNATPAATPIRLNTSLGGSPNKIQQALAETPYDGITATGNRVGSTFGVNIGGDRFGAPGKGEVSLKELNPEDIVVDATTRTTPVSAPVTSVGGGEITPEYLPKEDIVVDATERTTPVSGGLTLSSDTLADIDKGAAEEAEKKKKLGLEEYLRLAGLASGLIGGAAGAGQGQTGTYGGGGTGRLNPIFSAKLPSAGGLGAVGVNRTARPMGDVDWLTYGTRPELNFYDYAARPNPAPITTPVPGNPAGPIMQQRDPMAMAKGGRTEFAVNGPGTGRSDDIPAVLSDGEYVIDAETVALLGDGSSKAGAKKLDDLRVKVRKHKGQKLAKGRFSANAKKPEAYLSGGRI